MIEFVDRVVLGLHACDLNMGCKKKFLLFDACGALMAMLEAVVCYK